MNKRIINLILITNLIVTVFIIYTWIQNFYQVDFFITKNIHYHSRIIEGIKDSDDVEFVKKQAISMIESFDQITIEKNDKAIKISRLIAIIFILNMTVNVLIFVKMRQNATQQPI